MSYFNIDKTETQKLRFVTYLIQCYFPFIILLNQ